MDRHTIGVMRLVLGLLKGALIGGGLGYGAYAAGLGGGFNWLTYALVGFVVGLLAGRPIWSHLSDSKSTVWTPVLKGIFGLVFGIIVYAIVGKAWGTFDLTISALEEAPRKLHDWTFILGGGIGALFGAFVEVDDAPEAEK